MLQIAVGVVVAQWALRVCAPLVSLVLAARQSLALVITDLPVGSGIEFALELVDAARATIVLTAILFNKHVQLTALLAGQIGALGHGCGSLV